MMDYYEELGVERSASSEEIHQAYKQLARLVHPDHCSDDTSRRLADLQMKRLNGMLKVLTNPQDREEYDRSLAYPAVALSSPPKPSEPEAPAWLWPALAAILLAGILGSFARKPQPVLTAAKPDDPAATAVAPATKVSAAHTRDRRTRDSKPGDSERVDDPSGPGSQNPIAQRPTFEAGLEDPPPVSSTLPTNSALPAATALLATPTINGDWLFVPNAENKAAGLYVPEYIELRVVEEAGLVRGHYRARYHVADKAISPTVAFQFEGRGRDDSAKLAWTGAGGAKGEVTMRLLDSGSLEVTWEAHRMGAGLGLISGTATLVRRQE
jgi:curved DNA-binding protein CbpA